MILDAHEKQKRIEPRNLKHVVGPFWWQQQHSLSIGISDTGNPIVIISNMPLKKAIMFFILSPIFFYLSIFERVADELRRKVLKLRFGLLRCLNAATVKKHYTKTGFWLSRRHDYLS